ncbi:helix-turn-helix domain-containing protein [Streptosporangium sp. NPDC001559]|uniref:AraC-like ligand-binding domain-containing protein n=1 Tax=Streptosporangium sp. NPDC001559 TaxID=3366187 RepID=UPI0036EDC7DE
MRLDEYSGRLTTSTVNAEPVFRDHEPSTDRFIRRRETVGGRPPTVVRGDREEASHAVVRRIGLGALHLSWLSFPPSQIWLADTLIRRSAPGTYCLSLPLRGAKRLDLGSRQVIAGPGDLLFYDTTRPFHIHLLADATGGAESVILYIPKALMPLPADSLVRLAGRSLPCSAGVGALLRRHIIELARHTSGCSAADATRLSMITLDLVAATCAHVLEAGSSPQTESPRQMLRARIHAFIQRYLSDPELCPTGIAAAHQISVRYLHRLFQDQGLSVAAWIRSCRLERCRHDLADPALRLRPVHAIAARWGFANSAHFSRLFRAAYEISPIDYRHRIHLIGQQEPETPSRSSCGMLKPWGGRPGIDVPATTKPGTRVT